MDISKEETDGNVDRETSEEEEGQQEEEEEVEDERMESEAEAVLDEDMDENESDSDDDEVNADEAEVQSLQALLRGNPYDYASHTALINKLREMENERYRLQDARQNMSNAYPLSPELWLSWIRDEIKLVTMAEERAEVTQLCERAVEDYICKFLLQEPRAWGSRCFNRLFATSQYGFFSCRSVAGILAI